jgi:asparagine synthase (glutamine-hydrolysing)
MCGICGVVGRHPVDRDALARMTAAMRHRGPDDEGFYISESASGATIGLGFRRLSIIDLASGNQPIGNETGSIQLVMNGEIYNFRELRRELEAKGHRFTTGSDAEVIAHLYEDEGERCVKHLNGMFAIALWDAGRQELVLARDRFGKKPLYYTQLGEELLFASELKGLLEHPRCPNALDFDSLARYLALEYVPTPRSIFAGVQKLPAGHLLRWRQGSVSVEQYWDLSFGQDRDRRSEADYADELRTRLHEAVRRRLISDVPLGAFLSGGLDSSSVVAMMASELPAGALKTFSIGFAEQSFDESDHARRVAEHFGTDHHAETFTADVMLELLPTIADALDEPFADASILPTYMLSRFTRQFVTVALGGDGADELLAGYPTFPADRVARMYRMPRLLHEHVIAQLADRLPVSTSNFSTDFKIKQFARGALEPVGPRHAAWLGSFTPSEQGQLLDTSRLDPLAEYSAMFDQAPTDNSVERVIYAYVKTYLQDDILVKVDRASMACSLEVRAPFLDVDLVEFLGGVPAQFKLRRLTTKQLLKRAMAELLPHGIATRPKKGFGIPVAEWLKGPLRDSLQDELSPERIRAQGIFNSGASDRLIAEHMSGRRDHRKQLWTLYMFQLWHRTWIENRVSGTRGCESVPVASTQPGVARSAGR